MSLSLFLIALGSKLSVVDVHAHFETVCIFSNSCIAFIWLQFLDVDVLNEMAKFYGVELEDMTRIIREVETEN